MAGRFNFVVGIAGQQSPKRRQAPAQVSEMGCKRQKLDRDNDGAGANSGVTEAASADKANNVKKLVKRLTKRVSHFFKKNECFC